MNQQVLVVVIGKEKVALPMDSIGSLVEIGAITPAPRAPEHILGLAAVRSVAFTVVDPLVALGLPAQERADAMPSEAATCRRALAIGADNCHYALLISSAEGVATCLSEPQATKIPLRHRWPEVTIGEVETEEGRLLLIDPVAIIAISAGKPTAGHGPLRDGQSPKNEPAAKKSGAL